METQTHTLYNKEDIRPNGKWGNILMACQCDMRSPIVYTRIDTTWRHVFVYGVAQWLKARASFGLLCWTITQDPEW